MTTILLPLTEKEARILLLVLGVDLDALGVDPKDQPAIRAIVKKLKELNK